MKVRWGALALLCALAALNADSRSQQGTERIRVQTTLVNVPVMVSDQQGGAVLGLKAEDFVLYDDGDLQPLAFFAAASEPIRIALVLDTSKSTTTVLDGIRKAAVGFVSHLRPQDRAMVASFDSEVHVLCGLGSDERDLERAVRSAEVGAYVGTKMYDAVELVADKYLRSGEGRKAMILLTDGQDFGSRLSRDDMIRAVLDAGVVVYPVLFEVNRRDLVKKLLGLSLPKGSAGGADWEENQRTAADLLRRTAEDSAGAFYRSEATDFKKVFATVAEELRHQYLLAFYPDQSRIDGAQHTLRVTVLRPDLLVRARRSYRAAGAKSLAAGIPQGIPAQLAATSQPW